MGFIGIARMSRRRDTVPRRRPLTNKELPLITKNTEVVLQILSGTQYYKEPFSNFLEYTSTGTGF